MRLMLLVLSLSLSMTTSPLLAFESVQHALGVARDSASGQIRYVEHHQYLPDGRHQIHYLTADLKLIAYKKMSYPFLPWQPAIEQEDFNRQSRVVVDVTESEIKMHRQKGSDHTTTSLPAAPDLILDAGFDNYIQRNWEALRSTKNTNLQFAVAGLSKTLAMQVKPMPDAGTGHVGFRISPRNFFVRLVVPDIDLEYTIDRSLIRYTGYSNLVASTDGNKMVTIDFTRYETKSALELPLADWLPADIHPRIATTN